MTTTNKQVAEARLPLPPSVPHHIKDDAEAIEVAQRLAALFAKEAAVRDRERRLPWDELELYTASGLGGITVERQYGGAGVSYETLAKVFVILCAADPSLGQIPQNHFALIQNVRDIGTPSQQQRWFADALKGYRFGNAGPERKARGAQLVTDGTARLTRTAEGLRVTGTRFYSTGALFAHWIPFRAIDEDNLPLQVWVRRTDPGVEIIDDWSAFGQRTTASGSVRLNGVAVEEDNIIHVSRYANQPNLSGPVSQLIQVAIDVGIAEGALQDALQFVREKSRPWNDAGVARAADDPYIIQEVGKLQIDVHAAYEVLLATARTIDAIAKEPITEASSARASAAIAEAKILGVEAALDSSEKLLELAGSAATRATHNFDRHWRNARVHTLHDPVRWKYHLLGNYVLNGALPRRHQWN
jgi:SfnB family sulfur acquisition oxidoreductase